MSGPTALSRMDRSSSPPPLRLSVIIPVHNGAHELRRSLAALAASTHRPDQVIVVDDGSSDDPASVAHSFGAQVLNLPDGPHGPATARNRGAALARGDVCVFIDADVVVHDETLARMEKYLREEPGVAALFGSYDASPPEPGLVSQYKNLLHHYIHQHSRREAGTFWAGCGAMRRDVFVSLGGFDETYASPSIEDIELGVRLRRAGHRVWLCPDVQVTHLKRWGFISLLRTDIFGRAIPWSRLIVHRGQLADDLNLGLSSRLGAMSVWMALACLAAGFWSHWAWWGTLVGVSTLVAYNADLYRFFWRQGGARFATGAAGLHALYLLYSSLSFALVVISSWLHRRRPRLTWRTL